GSTHVHTVTTLGLPEKPAVEALFVAGILSSLVSDFQIRVVGRAHIHGSDANRLAMSDPNHPLAHNLAAGGLLLNSLTDAYADLWNSLTDLTSAGQAWTGGYGYPVSVSMDVLDYEWSEVSPLRLAADRRQAQVEIDALVALM